MFLDYSPVRFLRAITVVRYASKPEDISPEKLPSPKDLEEKKIKKIIEILMIADKSQGILPRELRNSLNGAYSTFKPALLVNTWRDFYKTCYSYAFRHFKQEKTFQKERINDSLEALTAAFSQPLEGTQMDLVFSDFKPYPSDRTPLPDNALEAWKQRFYSGKSQDD